MPDRSMYVGMPSVFDGEIPLNWGSLPTPSFQENPRVSPYDAVNRRLGAKVWV